MNFIPSRSLLSRRHGGVWLWVGGFVVVSLLTRVALLAKSWEAFDGNLALAKAFAWGLLFDLGAALLISVPLTLLLTALPDGFFARRWARLLAHGAGVVVLAALLFGGVAEWLFWDEFSTRFNFIAVDYLVYTTEVVANIRESYPLAAIFTVLALVSAAVYAALVRTGWVAAWLEAPVGGGRWRAWPEAAGWLGAAALAGVVLDSARLPAFPNTYNRELAKNGVWSLVAAFRDNELDYAQFYPTLPVDEAFRNIRAELTQDGSELLSSADGRDTLRYVKNEGPELHPNVIQITVESLSADFLSTFNHASHLTPNLEALARESLVFDNFYASGTRTDRGMEALTLGIPPTPGRSLIKRPHNRDLFTLGSVFRSRGYDTAFIYGGYGYFDNMNAYFGGNGYRVVDRAAVSKRDITFANAWGACDEDLYRWTLREADAAAGKPFHFFVMTTSNHRPFTYPEGKIDLPPKVSGRAGAVKYTDYAIGEFLRQAATRPWFKNTVFVIVADHCASVAGKTELPVQNYHIPLFIYAPGGQVKPGRITDLTGQVDYPATLLGLLNWSYATRFYGWDVRRSTGDRRALIGNYQKLGLYEPGALNVLSPVRSYKGYAFDPLTFDLTLRTPEAEERDETIAYYQTASYMYQNNTYKALTPEEQAAFTAARSPLAIAGEASR